MNREQNIILQLTIIAIWLTISILVKNEKIKKNIKLLILILYFFLVNSSIYNFIELAKTKPEVLIPINFTMQSTKIFILIMMIKSLFSKKNKKKEKIE